jgi:hypothetical protein
LSFAWVFFRHISNGAGLASLKRAPSEGRTHKAGNSQSWHRDLLDKVRVKHKALQPMVSKSSSGQPPG